MIQPLPFMRAIPRTDIPPAASGRPLAGSAHVWWDTVQDLPAKSSARRIETLDPVTVSRLSDPRPLLPGLPTDRPLVMGIVNATPDSFSDGGTLNGVAGAVARAQAMVEGGADILDIGGESTRPGATVVPVSEEITRTAPVISAIREAGIATPISIDTRKAEVARAALAAGADIVNDVSALSWDPDLVNVVAEARCPVCLMHAQGTPQTMQDDPRYDDVLTEVFEYLAERINHAVEAGIARNCIIADPGIGFGKTQSHNLQLLRALSVFHSLGVAILLGASRKRFIGTISGVEDAAKRVPGSLAVALMAAAQGAQIVRVHDVDETVQALALWRALTFEGDIS